MRRPQPILSLGLLVVALAIGCAPDAPELVLTWPDGDKITYSAADSTGDPAALMQGDDPLSVFHQIWTSGGDAPRDTVTMDFGSWIESVAPAAGIERDVAWFTALDGERVGADLSITDVRFTRDPELPVLYSAELGGPSQGTVRVGPSCGESARSNHGCGFAAAEGVESGSVEWAGDDLIPWEDGCSGSFWSGELAAGSWTWTEDTLTLANGRELDCVMSPRRELVCSATWTAKVPVSVGPDCPWSRTLVVWPEIGASERPEQLHAYFYAESRELVGAEIDICAAGNSCVAFR